MANTDAKLTADQQGQVIEWLCEGIGNKEIVQRLVDEHGVEVTPQAIDYYRGAYAEQIDEARDKALLKRAQRGYANRLKRLEELEKLATRASQLTVGGGKGWTQMSAELRAILKDIRDELGDLKQRHEHSGPGGGAVQVEQSNRIVLDGEAALAVIAFHEGAEEDGGEPDGEG